MWLAIHLPQLPLETLLFDTQESHQLESDITDSHKPQAVIENNLVICVNQSAYQYGVKISQSLTSAYALCDDIQLLERNLAQEKQQLRNLALAIYHYSPNIAIEEKGWLVIEIARSLKLYNGLNNLVSSIEHELQQQGLTFRLAIGHTPKSAQLLSYRPLSQSMACWQQEKQTIDIALLETKLATMSVELLDIPEKMVDKIHSVGIQTLSELIILPERSLRKRFGEVTSRYLLQVYAKLPEPKNYFTPAETFYEKLEFVDVVHHREGLLFPIKRLVKNLCRFLIVKQKNCQSLRWELWDSEKNVIGFDVLISDSRISEKVYIELTQLNLERYSLHAPIESIALTANRLLELNGQSQSLFETDNDFKQSTHFINKIRAKLGNESCYRLQQKNEHVPELACHQVTDIEAPGYAANDYSSLNVGDQLDIIDEHADSHSLIRPSWLLEKPKPIHFNQRKLIWQGELQIISAQERITSYWWKKKIARDYFLAEHENGTLYWVFYDQVRRQWFLHGIYS